MVVCMTKNRTFSPGRGQLVDVVGGGGLEKVCVFVPRHRDAALLISLANALLFQIFLLLAFSTRKFLSQSLRTERTFLSLYTPSLRPR